MAEPEWEEHYTTFTAEDPDDEDDEDNEEYGTDDGYFGRGYPHTSDEDDDYLY